MGSLKGVPVDTINAHQQEGSRVPEASRDGAVSGAPTGRRSLAKGQSSSATNVASAQKRPLDEHQPSLQSSCTRSMRPNTARGEAEAAYHGHNGPEHTQSGSAYTLAANSEAAAEALAAQDLLPIAVDLNTA